MSSEINYGTMTPQEYDEILREVIDDLGASELFDTIPAVRGPLRWELNDDVLKRWSEVQTEARS